MFFMLSSFRKGPKLTDILVENKVVTPIQIITPKNKENTRTYLLFALLKFSLLFLTFFWRFIYFFYFFIHRHLHQCRHITEHWFDKSFFLNNCGVILLKISIPLLTISLSYYPSSQRCIFFSLGDIILTKENYFGKYSTTSL